MGEWFANPLGLWAAALVAPLLLLYMLKHRPVRRRVPSTLLWKGVVQAQVATSPFQRLRKSLSLLLMLLALASLVLALAGLQIPGGAQRGVPLMLVVDTTASMGASHGNRTRMDAARDYADQVIAAAGDTRVTLLQWDGAIRTVGVVSGTPAAARSALNELTPSATGSNVSALSRALSQLQRSDEATVVFIGDGRSGVAGDVGYIAVGEAAPNFAIVTAGMHEPAPGLLEVNFGVEATGIDQPRRVTFAIEKLNGEGTQLMDARDIELHPGRREVVTFSADSPGMYRGVLRAIDALAADNEAWVRCVPLPVLAVSVDEAAPKPVHEVLVAIEQGMGTIRLAPSQADAFVLAGAGSGGALTRLPAAYIGPEAAPPGITFAPAVDASGTPARPLPGFLWRGAGTPSVAVKTAQPIEFTGLLNPVLEVDGGAAIALAERDTGLQDLVIGLPLEGEQAGTFAAQPEFLVFWANWFDHIRALAEPLPRGALNTRDTLRVRPLEGRGAFKVSGPSGQTQEVNPGEGVAVHRQGIYRVEGLDCEVPLVGAALLDAEESNLGGVDSTGNSATLDWVAGGSREGGTVALELAPWLALIGAGLLITEWLLFRRRFPRRTLAQDASGPRHTPAAGV